MRRRTAACGSLAIAVVACAGGGSAYATAEPAAVVGHPADPARPAPARWSLGASIGPLVAVLEQPGRSVWPLVYPGWSHVTAWQLELLRRRVDRHAIFGGALEGTYGGVGPQLLAAHAFAGGEWRYHPLTLQATFGIGLEAAEVNVEDPELVPRNGRYIPPVETYQLGVYGQGALGAALAVSDSIELLLQCAVHLTATHDENWFGASMLGVRYRLP